MNFLQYLRFIPLLMQLVEFIHQAEAEFRGPDSGPEKLSWVVSKFGPLVSTFASAGLIPAKLADVLVSGATAIISLIVQLMNATGGVRPVPADPTSIEYDTLEAAEAATTPADSTVWQKANGKFVVWPNLPGPGVQVWP